MNCTSGTLHVGVRVHAARAACSVRFPVMLLRPSGATNSTRVLEFSDMKWRCTAKWGAALCLALSQNNPHNRPAPAAALMEK